MQVLIFTILHAVCALPETTLIRHICLIGGALLAGLRDFSISSNTLNTICDTNLFDCFLFIWTTFKLFFLSDNLALSDRGVRLHLKAHPPGRDIRWWFGSSACQSTFLAASFQLTNFYLGLLTLILIYVVKYAQSQTMSVLLG